MIEIPVYLDHHSTTPLDPGVFDAMRPFFSERFGNAASIHHSLGRDAQVACEHAREQVATFVDATPNEIIFTSGATESNNLAIKGVARMNQRKGKHLVTITTEHPSVLDPVKRLAREGWQVTILPVDQQGLVDLQKVEDSLNDQTILLSVMLANNETGVLQPLKEIAEICDRKGVLLHSDVTQAVGKIPDTTALQACHLLSFTAHKTYGPKGIGALCIRRRRPAIRIEPLFDGGGHEKNLRSGTLPVPSVVGFGHACAIAMAEIVPESVRIGKLRDRLYHGICSQVSDVTLNGHDQKRLPGNLNLSFDHVDGEALMMNMQQVAVSSGSACSSVHPEPSHVLLALGISEEQARASLRFGIGRFNTEPEIDFSISEVAEAVTRLRTMSTPPKQ